MMGGNTENHENDRVYPTMMASFHNRGSRQQAEFRGLESEAHSSSRHDALRHSLDLIRIL